MDARRDADAAGLGQAFEPGGDVYAIAEDVAVLDHDVTHVDTNAEVDAPVIGYRSVTLDHSRLHIGRTTQGIHHAAKLDEQPITRRLNEPAIVRGDRRINQFGADRLERLESPALVRPDQS